LGEHAKLGIRCRTEDLSPISPPEQRYDQRKGLPSDRRLACQARLQGDVVIDVPPESQVHKQIVRKRPDVRAVEIDPVVRLCYVEMSAPTMGDQRSDVRRLSEA
ncbi:MAG: drug:proton antiporter, partial [Gammaproteobacteria bacterium]|nr:drug:proton antiporter [Gammaproteobacteria bacterium]